VVGDGAAARGAKDAEAVAVVDDEGGAVAREDIEEFGERGNRTISSEDAVGENGNAGVAKLADHPRGRVGLEVLILKDLHARANRRVTEAAVGVTVNEGDAVVLRERLQRHEVGGVSLGGENRGLLAHECGEVALAGFVSERVACGLAACSC
jgi:hypothetical protein